MNPALWKKAVADAWLQLVISCAVLVLFGWLFVWLMSMFQIGAWAAFLNLLPRFFEPMLGIPVAKLATPAGQISVLFVHPVTMAVCVGWALGRGSDPIGGEIGRGTMDLILSLPVRRASVIVPPAVVAAAGAAVLAASILAGIAIGLAAVAFGGNVALRMFLPGAVNLFAMVVCLTSMTMLISSFSLNRWNAMLVAAGFFVVSLIIDTVGQMWSGGAWLKYLSFLTAFHPQQLILLSDEMPHAALKYNATLLALGMLCYGLTAVVLCRRDIPEAR